MGKRDTRDTSKPATAREGEFDQAQAGLSDDPEPLTDTASDVGSDDATEFGSIPKVTRAQVEPHTKKSAPIGAPLKHRTRDDLEIPPLLDRRPQPRQDGKWAGTYLSDDDIEFLERGFK
jgi:hypothetical protein